MPQLTAGRKVLVKSLSLQFGDYRNLDGEVLEIHDEFASVAVPKSRLSVEDLRDLKKVGDRAVVRVKISSLV